MDFHPRWFFIFTPLAGLLLNISTQIFIFRFFKERGLLKSVFLGFLVGWIAMGLGDVAVYFQFPDKITDKDFYALLFTNFIIYSFLGYFYFSSIGMGETARRVRIMVELFYSKNGLTLEEILSRYSAKDMVEMRVKRLVRNRQVRYENNRYYISNPDMLILSRLAIFMKLFVLGKASEYEKD